ncbi:MAG TPA: hypothetical protein V6D35_22350 [Candidatus Sericytochromatia bacterium]
MCTFRLKLEDVRSPFALESVEAIALSTPANKSLRTNIDFLNVRYK